MPITPIKITCDDDHRYHLRCNDGKMREVPSVTEIMRDVGYYPWTFKKREPDDGSVRFPSEDEDKRMNAARRGTAVHKITEDLDRGQEIGPVDPELLPYVEAYKKFRKENDITITNIERFVYNEEFWYAGALDRVMTINGTPSIVDIKTGVVLKTTGLQLAAYRFAWEKMGGDKGLVRIALHLNNTEKYKSVTYRSSEDLPNFLAAVRVYHFKRNK
jgi:hypothetical protein